MKYMAKSIGVSEKNNKFIENYIFTTERNYSEKFNTIIEHYNALIKYTLHELGKKFTTDELIAIMDSVNGWLYDTSFTPKMALYYEVNDSIIYNKTDERFNVDKKELLSKLENLTNFQAHVLIMELQKLLQDNNGKCNLNEIIENRFLTIKEDDKEDREDIEYYEEDNY